MNNTLKDAQMGAVQLTAFALQLPRECQQLHSLQSHCGVSGAGELDLYTMNHQQNCQLHPAPMFAGGILQFDGR